MPTKTYADSRYLQPAKGMRTPVQNLKKQAKETPPLKVNPIACSQLKLTVSNSNQVLTEPSPGRLPARQNRAFPSIPISNEKIQSASTIKLR